MDQDISLLLNDWPYESGKIVARTVRAADGTTKIQVRLDLGIIQMNSDGRPDGARPFGFESVLDYLEAKVEHPEGMEAGSGPGPVEPRDSSDGEEEPDIDFAGSGGFSPNDHKEEEPGTLSGDECRMLREEAAQYYQRYLALLTLEDFGRVIRDTTRNLRVLDLCRKHASEDDDRTVLEQFRPYITMVRSRALASRALAADEPKAALHAIDEGLEALKRFFADHGQAAAFDESDEVRMLRSMREALVPKLPVSQKAELKQRLAKAIEQENYELAAILRDELRQLGDEAPKDPAKDAPKPSVG